MDDAPRVAEGAWTPPPPAREASADQPPMNSATGPRNVNALAHAEGADTTFSYEYATGWDHRVEIHGLDFMRDAAAAFFFSLITSLQTRSMSFTVGRQKYELDCSAELTEKEDERPKVGNFLPSDLLPPPGPLSRAAFAAIVNAVARVFGGEHVALPPASDASRSADALRHALRHLHTLADGRAEIETIGDVSLVYFNISYHQD